MELEISAFVAGAKTVNVTAESGTTTEDLIKTVSKELGVDKRKLSVVKHHGSEHWVNAGAHEKLQGHGTRYRIKGVRHLNDIDGPIKVEKTIGSRTTKFHIEEAKQLQEEMMAAYMEPSFQEKLKSLQNVVNEGKLDFKDYPKRLQTITHPVQMKVMPKYGFRGKFMVQEMNEAFVPHEDDPANNERAMKLLDALGIGPTSNWYQPPKISNAVLLFPGQGSQYIGMMKAQAQMPVVQEMMTKAKEILGYDVMEMCTTGTEDQLSETRHCQPAMYIAGLVAMEVLRESKPDIVSNPTAVAGLSLGEYTALVAAGVLTFEEGLELVKLRADAMQRAAEVRPQGMYSVAGLSKAKVEELCREAIAKDTETADPVCQIANCLFTEGFAVSGTTKTVEMMSAAATEAGALQSRAIKTGGAFHSSLMAPAEVELGRALDQALPKMKPPKCAIYFNVTGQKVAAHTNPAAFIDFMKQQLTSPVLWEQSMQDLTSGGAKEFFECGPNKQLKAMMKRINQTAWKATENVAV